MIEKNAGVIYSISPTDLNKIKKIPSHFTFVKFLTHETIPNFIENAKLLIYKSHSKKQIIGKGNISSTELLSEDNLLKKYPNSLLISKERLREYVGGRKHKRLLVLNIDNFRIFNKPLYSIFNITMAGRLLSMKDYEILIKG